MSGALMNTTVKPMATMYASSLRSSSSRPRMMLIFWVKANSQA